MSALRALNSVPDKIQGRIGFLRGMKPGLARTLVIVALGLFAINVANLVLSNITIQSTYKLAALKAERNVLSTEAEVVGTKVNSLASNQNLVDVAHALGMVSNVNPVFLRLSDGQVIGKPKRALANQRSVAANLVPNAAMNTDTNTELLSKNSDVSLVGSTGSATTQAGTGTIQASPTY